MKIVGAILITIGLALLLFVAINFLQAGYKMVSPIPEQKGVKVIFVTPAT